MALIQWRDAFDPFAELREFQERVNRLFESRFGAGLFGIERGTSTFPPLDVREDAENVYVVAELPGISQDALDLTITGDTLQIKGERKAPDVPEESYHRRERPYGYFNRLVSLPDRVDADKIRATLKDGILQVTLPKAESARPRQIKVASA